MYAPAVHRRLVLFFLLCGLASLFMSPALAQSGAQNDAPSSPLNVLILNSWHKGLPWQESFESGLTEGLKTDLHKVRIFNEYLDAARTPNISGRPEFPAYLRAKYENIKIDVVVAESTPASELLSKFSSGFPNAKQIYVQPGFSPQELEKIKGDNQFIIPVQADFSSAIDEMLRLVSPKRIYVISDTSSPSRLKRLQNFQAALDGLDTDADVKFLLDLPMETLLERVANLPKGSAIYYLLIFKDGAGKAFVPYEALKPLAERASVPVFSHWESLMGSGMLGGQLLSGKQVGRIAATAILKQTDPRVSNQPLPGAYVYEYDWRQMKRWGISNAELPPGAIIRFYEPDVFERYRWQILVTLSALFLLSALTIGLLVLNRKRHLAVMELRGERALLETRTQELLIARDKAEAASRTKSEFLANMSHELRTPLNAILGFAGAMKSYIFGPIGCDKYEEYIDNIHESGEHLLELISDILDLSQVEEGVVTLYEEKFDLVAVCDSVMRLVRPRAEKQRVALTNQAAGEQITVFADQRRVKQILFNLLTNAIKFTDPEGKVTLNIELDEKNAVRLSVTDTGIGMNEDELIIALARFGQVDGSWTRKHEGVGLGLALTEALAKIHDGTLSIESQKGHGTTVTVWFPTERVVLPTPEAQAAVAS